MLLQKKCIFLPEKPFSCMKVHLLSELRDCKLGRVARAAARQRAGRVVRREAAEGAAGGKRGVDFRNDSNRVESSPPFSSFAWLYLDFPCLSSTRNESK